MKYFSFILAAFFFGAAHANETSTDNRIIDLGVLENERVAITGPALSVRFGNAVMVKVFYSTFNHQAVRAASFLATCDGQWISRRIRISFFKKGDADWSPIEWESIAREKWMEDSGDTIEMNPWAYSQQKIAGPLKQHLKTICDGAIPEIPGRLLTIESTSPDKNDKYRFYSIVSGTAIRDKETIEVWERTTEMHFVKKDEPPKRTGNYTLVKGVYDCKNKKGGVYDFNDYKAGSNLPKRQHSQSPVNMRSAIPGTISFGTMQLVCLLYGD